MTPLDSLRSRVVKAYLLFAFGCALIFTVATAIVIESLEVRLVDQRLREVADWAAPRLAGKLPVEMPAGVSFQQGDAIPVSLRNVSEGIHDIEVDGVSMHVYASRTAAGPFVVIDHESDYETVEMAVYTLVAIGFLGFVVMSSFLGRFLANRIVTPITALSDAVRERRPTLPLLDNQDEMGVLARAFAAQVAEQRMYLERERHFTGDVSHELRTPLTVIAGAAEILLDATRDQPALHAPVERIARAAAEASHSVSTLLLLARSPELLPAQEVSAAAVVQDELARHQNLVEAKPVRLLDGGGPDFTIAAPAILLSTALGNLIRNACLYTAAGSVTVTRGERSISVGDTGPGIPPAVLAMLHGTERLQGSAGTGLGLVLVQRICQLLGATIDAENTGHGATVTLHFPALTKS